MQTVGIICEYNPLHLGHQKQFIQIRNHFGEDCAIICLMSGNYVQRGSPAIFASEYRAKAAILSGADLVLELPVTASLSSAEGFAQSGVRILSTICDTLSFGAENDDTGILLSVSDALLSPDFSISLRSELDTGRSFPAARQRALEKIGIPADILQKPNNILAVEYCKAILALNSSMAIYPILRRGDYHSVTADAAEPSATFLRNQIISAVPWQSYVPDAAVACLSSAPVHTMAAGQLAVLSKLRIMTDAEFASLPFGSEGLWRKLMHASRRCASLPEILEETKSRRYTRSRLDRMVMCAFLGITQELLSAPIPYTRILAFSDRGRAVLKTAKQNGMFLNAGEAFAHPYYELEKRCGDLYGLFAVDGPEPPGLTQKQRVYVHKSEVE